MSKYGNPLSYTEEMPGYRQNNLFQSSFIPECESLISIKLPQTVLHCVGCIYEPIYEAAHTV